MSRLTNRIAATFLSLGLLTSGAAFAAEQPAAAAPQVAEAATAPATVHSDPIVQKRMEVREANREQRAQRAEARKAFRAEAREARQQRNESVSESRDRARAALAESEQPAARTAR